MTRSITIGIPVGVKRTLNFSGDTWRGMVEISAGGDTWTVDTYSNGQTAKAVEIGRSSTGKLICEPLRHIAVFTVLFWSITLRRHSMGEVANFYVIPSIGDFRAQLYDLPGKLEMNYQIAILGIDFAAALLPRILKKADAAWEDIYQSLCAGIFVGILILLYIYGNCINRESTMWNYRYFLCLVPYIALLCALTVIRICRMKDTGINQILENAVSVFFGIFLVLNCMINAAWCNVNFPYREEADTLFKYADYIYNNDNVVISMFEENDRALDGWKEYYVTRQGRRDTLNIISQWG